MKKFDFSICVELLVGHWVASNVPLKHFHSAMKKINKQKNNYPYAHTEVRFRDGRRRRVSTNNNNNYIGILFHSTCQAYNWQHI
jgi:hypothetical protein